MANEKQAGVIMKPEEQINDEWEQPLVCPIDPVELEACEACQ